MGMKALTSPQEAVECSKGSRQDDQTSLRWVGPAQTNSVPNSSSDPRAFKLVRPSLGNIGIEVMTYSDGTPDLRPLLILNSIEFPMPPSILFCEKMKRHGLQVVFVRRLGFGGTPSLPRVLLSYSNIKNGAASVTEASIIAQTIRALNLQNIVLLGIGSANHICYRLCRLSPEIVLSVFSNAAFNQDYWGGFKPSWLRSVLQQSVITKRGFQIATKSLKHYLRKEPISFFEQLFSTSFTDQQYLRENSADFLEASELLRCISAETYYYELAMSLGRDPFLSDRFFEHLPAVVLEGPDETERWTERTKYEAERLCIPIVYAPRGGMLVAYSSPDSLIDAVRLSAQTASTD